MQNPQRELAERYSLELQERVQKRGGAWLERVQDLPWLHKRHESEDEIEIQKRRDARILQLSQCLKPKYAEDADTLSVPIMSVAREAWVTELRQDDRGKSLEAQLELQGPPWGVGNCYR